MVNNEAMSKRAISPSSASMLPTSKRCTAITVKHNTNDNNLPFVTNLYDDTLLRILAYADLPSLVRFTRGTSKALRGRFVHTTDDCIAPIDASYAATSSIESSAASIANIEENTSYCTNVWRQIFTNHNFSPLEKSDITIESLRINYFSAIQHRLALFAMLTGKNKRLRNLALVKNGESGTKTRQVKQCFSLPNRHFNFVPLVPPDMMHYPPSNGFDPNSLRITYLNEEGESEDEGSDDEFDMELEEESNNNNNLDEMHDFFMAEMDTDPPPVEFACDSYSLTSPGTGGEFVLLNPFSGSVEVHDSILDNAIGSEESMMEMALLDASEGIIRKRGRHEDGMDDEKSEDIAGEAIHCRIQQSHCHSMYDTPPKQVLFSVNDYFELDLNEYFGEYTPFKSTRQGTVTVDWVGVDSHVAMNSDCTSLDGSVIGAARILTMESDRNDGELACTEVFAWSNIGSEGEAISEYETKYVCRAAGSFYFLDICANYQKLYASFQYGSGAFSENVGESMAREGWGNRPLMEIDDESLVDEDGEPIRMSKAVFCLPLVMYDGSPASHEDVRSYFPSPEACIMAQYPVSSFSVDPTGKILLVGTVYGTVEVWETGMSSTGSHSEPRRLQVLSVRESFLKRARSMTVGERSSSECGVEVVDVKPQSIEHNPNARGPAQDDLALLDSSAEEEFAHKHPTTKISQIYFPRHLPVQRCGFVTKQRNGDSGTTLLLWQTAGMSCGEFTDPSDQRFQITAMINLPLSVQCHPEVHFDGRRLIVFGQDHIGLIFLVYHVLGTRYDQEEFDDEKMSAPANQSTSDNGEESGGVTNLHGERRMKFVNRIRHAGLGGLEYYDSLLMTANERFIVVNTKTGNLIGSDGVRNASQGLLVIDLQKHEGRF